MLSVGQIGQIIRMSNLCVCDSGQPYADCCQPILTGAPAPSAEALMRSRFTAYVEGDTNYLLKSWHATTRPPAIELNPKQKWLGLKIKAVGQQEGEHFVEFVARFKIDGRGHRLHERSRFVQEQGQWYYLDGQLKDSSR